MYLASLRLKNFRRLGHSEGNNQNNSDFFITFHKGLNVLVGRNDEGKSAIIDAIRIVLKTHSLDKNRIEQDDFFYNKNRKEYANQIRIELIFQDLSDEEKGKFVEWLTWRNSESGPVTELRIIYEARYEQNKILPADVKAGSEGHETYLEAEAREYLRITYLKPLRDAENELHAKRNSRLSQILMGHAAFKEGAEGHTKILNAIEAANKEIRELLNENPSNCNIKEIIDKYIQKFIGEEQEASIIMSPPHIRRILENLDICLNDGINHGLGALNRLYMATELMHLDQGSDRLPLCLIEEIEAHLHPQAQMKVVNTLLKIADSGKNQFIITTHSPNITSKLPLKSLIMIDGGNAYSLAHQHTNLSEADYRFLEIFLDTTKANLFFAKGIILVEGWSEMLLVPAIAKCLNLDLEASEVSIINVGNTGYLHYAKIFQRKNSPQMGIRVAVISDLDMQPDISVDGAAIPFEENKIVDRINAKKEKIQIEEDENIKIFFSTPWTLEWSIANSCLEEVFLKCLKIVHPSLYNNENDINTNWKKILHQQLCSNRKRQEMKALSGKCASNLNKTEIAYSLAHELIGSTLDVRKLDQLQYIIDALNFVCNKRYDN